MPTILLVEDDPAVRKMMRQMLTNLGYAVLEAGSAPEAIEAASAYEQPIDVVVTDVVMPHTNCEELVTELQRQRPNLKVIYISGYSEEILNRHGAVYARPDFIHKPFRVEELAAKLREVLGGGISRTAGGGKS